MQALQCLFRNRLILRRALGCSAYTCHPTKWSFSKKISTIPRSFVLRQKIKTPANSTLKFSLSGAQTRCSMPVSRQLFDHRVSSESEPTSLESHVQESSKSHQAGLHHASILKSKVKSCPTKFASEVSTELHSDLFIQKFLYHSPFSCSECSTDRFEVQLSNCAEVSQVFGILEANVHNFSIENAVMVVGKLWQLCSNGCVDSNLANTAVEIPKNWMLNKLLQIIENQFHQLDDIKISCLLVQLNCLGLSHDTFIGHKMLFHFFHCSDKLSLEALARILLFLRNPDLNHSTKGKFMPILVKYLEDCNSKNDFLLIHCCYMNSQKLLPLSVSELHSKKIGDLLDAGEICSEDPKLLIMMLESFLRSENTFPYEKLIGRVCSMLVLTINSFEPTELINLSTYCGVLKLNRHLMNALYKEVALAMEEATDPVIRARLFLCMSAEEAQKFHPEILPLVKSLFQSPTNEDKMKALYLVLRSRAVTDRSLLDKYWDTVLHDLDETMSCPEISSDDGLGLESVMAQVVFRYLHFSSNLGGQYRHRRLEAKVIKLLQEEFNGVAGLLPKRVANMASFLLAYSDPLALPSWLVVRLTQFADKFSLQEVDAIKQGLKMSQLLNSHCRHEKYVSKLLSLAHLLFTCVQRLAAETTDLNDLAVLIRICNTVDSIFAKYGVKNPSIMSRSNSSWSRGLLSSAVQTSSPPPLSPPYDGLMHVAQSLRPNSSPPQDWQSTSFGSEDRPHHASSPWSYEVSPLIDANESLTQARVAPFVARNVHKMNFMSANTLAQICGRSNFFNVQVLDGLLKYLYEKRADTRVLIVAQALEGAFQMGHAPNLPLDSLRAIATVLTEDLNSLHGLPLISSALALSYYQSLPNSLIKKIFNVGFMDYLDNEMENSFSKRHYPVRVRRRLMELNRSVCIDYPESCVPWFHEEYCHDSIQTVPLKRDGFFADVHNLLTKVLGDERFFSSQTYSPYYHLMDFSFVLNDKQKAVMQRNEPTVLQSRVPEALTPLPPGYTRHCILLLNPLRFVVRQSISDTGVVSVRPQLKGPMQLMQRHLEVLGYDVISIARHDWQSMSLGTAASKEAYIREKIFGCQS